MKSHRVSSKVATRMAGRLLIGTVLLLPPAAVLGAGTDDGCGVAESCLVMSPSPHSPSSKGARGTARGRESSAPAKDRKAPRKVRASKKVDPSTPTLVATDVSTGPKATGEPSLLERRTK
jgi:hypothetical protein